MGKSTGKSIRTMLAALGALALTAGVAVADKVTIAVGGAGCLCYLPTMLAEQLGEYKKAGVEVELVDFKGGSQSLTAVIGGSADVVSGYFDHCVNLAAKNQALEAFVVYDRYPGLALVVGPKQTGKINSVKDLKDKKVSVSTAGSLTYWLTMQLSRSQGWGTGGINIVPTHRLHGDLADHLGVETGFEHAVFGTDDPGPTNLT